MRRPRVLASGAFRLALVFAALFAAGAVTLFAAVDIAVRQYALRTTASELVDESALLRAEAAPEGRSSLVQLISRRERIVKARQFSYLLADPHGARLAGDLPAQAGRVGYGEARVPPPAEALEDGEEQTTVRSFGVRLGDGALLVVGRNTYDLKELSEWLDRVTLWSGVGVTALAIVGGYLIAAIFLRRLDGLSDSLQRIMAGSLGERVPEIGMGDEFARLTTNLNRMLDRMEGLMGSLKQVSADVAHDLRTPLSRLRQHLESSRGLEATGAREEAIDEALVQVDEVLATFQAVLRIGEIEGGAGRARFRPVSLSDVIERVRLAYEPSAEDAAKTLDAEIEPGVEVMGDSELLTQLFSNLLENALTHAGPNARIRIRLAPEPGGWLATVSDDGPGVPVGDRERVLLRFHRLDTSRSTPGSGLGLALVAAIAELHEASLRLSDNAPGLLVSVGFTDLRALSR